VIDLITSFSPEGYNLYGKRCLGSLVKFWPPEVEIKIFCDPPLDKYDFRSIYKDNITILDISQETPILDYLPDFSWHPRMTSKTNYRLQGVRFCHKVFAMTVPGGRETRIWLDADTVTTGLIDLQYLSGCLPAAGETCSYLGRTQWHHSETGWLGFDMNCRGRQFLDSFLDMYRSGNILLLDETHDAFAFDVLRRQKEALGWKFRNLSPNAVGLDAWGHSPLSQRMIHFKGNEKRLA